MTDYIKVPRDQDEKRPYVDWFEVAARRKLGVGNDWIGAKYEAVAGGFLVSIAKPIGVYAKGKKKGQPKYPHSDTYQRVILRREDLDLEEAEYEKSTGNCAKCYGTGLRAAGGDTTHGYYRNCSKCNNTGKVPVA